MSLDERFLYLKYKDYKGRDLHRTYFIVFEIVYTVGGSERLDMVKSYRYSCDQNSNSEIDMPMYPIPK